MRSSKRALAHLLRRLDGEHHDLLDRGDDPDEEERLRQQLPLLHGRPDREQQLHDDEDQQQDVEQVQDRLLREVRDQPPGRLPGEHQADQRSGHQESGDPGVDDVLRDLEQSRAQPADARPGARPRGRRSVAAPSGDLSGRSRTRETGRVSPGVTATPLVTSARSNTARVPLVLAGTTS